MWIHLETKACLALENMQQDEQLLEELTPASDPILHLYEWLKPSFTYGYFIKPEDFLDMDACKKNGLDFARRPTGGGIIFHLTDLAFSVLIPSLHEGYSENVLENYHYVNQKVKQAVSRAYQDKVYELLSSDPQPLDSSSSRFCMAQPTIYDVMIGSKKIAGSAQRKKKQGYLHQGSISLALADEKLLQEVLLPSTKVLDGMKAHTLSLVPNRLEEIEKAKKVIIAELKKVFS